MKTLVLIRHSKSSWAYPELNDLERPLNKRGENDAPLMAEVLKTKNIKPDVIISSPALRALVTAQVFAKALGYVEEQIVVEKIIYESGSKNILDYICNLDDVIKTALIFGHNPDLTYLATYLSSSVFDNVPTTGIVCIDFEVSSWKEIYKQPGKLRFFEYPKKYRK